MGDEEEENEEEEEAPWNTHLQRKKLPKHTFDIGNRLVDPKSIQLDTKIIVKVNKLEIS